MKNTGIHKVIAKRSYRIKYGTVKSKQFAYSELVIIRDFTER